MEERSQAQQNRSASNQKIPQKSDKKDHQYQRTSINSTLHSFHDIRYEVGLTKMESLPQFSTATSLKDAMALELSAKISSKLVPFYQDPFHNETVVKEHKENTLKKSLIDELVELEDEKEPLEIPGMGKNTIELFECVEANSFRESESDEEESRISEAIELTPQEKIFFTNFVPPTSDTINIFDKVSSCQYPFSINSSRKIVSSDSQPANKRKVIKNFFKPKDSLIKDDKTCCSSQILAETKLKQGMSRLKLLNLQQNPTKLHVDE